MSFSRSLTRTLSFISPSLLLGLTLAVFLFTGCDSGSDDGDGDEQQPVVAVDGRYEGRVESGGNPVNLIFELDDVDADLPPSEREVDGSVTVSPFGRTVTVFNVSGSVTGNNGTAPSFDFEIEFPGSYSGTYTGTVQDGGDTLVGDFDVSGSGESLRIDGLEVTKP